MTEPEVETTAGPRARIRRLAKWTVVGIVLAAFGLGFLWTFGVPKYRPGLRDGEMYGLDVSHHQGTINWAEVASNNISFVYLKATEGGDYLDSQLAVNAKAAGVWQRHLFTRPNNDKWVIWQVSGFAKVKGIDGPVDLNIMKTAFENH